MTIKHISCFVPAPLFLAGGLVGAVFQVFRRTAVKHSSGDLLKGIFLVVSCDHAPFANSDVLDKLKAKKL